MNVRQGVFPILTACLISGCASDKSVERGPQGTIGYNVSIEASEVGVKIEADGEYVGTTPLVLKVWGDRDGTFHNFGSYSYTVRALPMRSGQLEQVKVFHTGGWFTPEDRIPKRLYFEMSMVPAPVPARSEKAVDPVANKAPVSNTGESPRLAAGGVFLTPENPATRLLLYAGPSHKTYLGCITCDSDDPESIWNRSGEYGSRINDHSIWNVVSEYGGRIGTYSPFNPISDDPPVIVDEDGGYYGRWSVSPLILDKTKIGNLNELCQHLAEGL